MVECWTLEGEVRGFETYLRRVVSLSKFYLLPESTGNNQERVALSQRHDRKIVDWDVKPRHKQTSYVVSVYFYSALASRFKIRGCNEGCFDNLVHDLETIHDLCLC